MFKGEKRGVSLSPDKIKNEQSSVVGYKQENPAKKTGKKTSLNSKDIGGREQTAGCIHVLESSFKKGDSRFGDIPCSVNLNTISDREKSPRKGSSSRFFSNSTRHEEFSSLPNKKQNSRDECFTNVSCQRQSADRLVLNQRNDTSPESTKRLSSVKCSKAEIFVEGDNPKNFGKRQSVDTLKSIHREFSPVLNKEQSPDKFHSSRTVTTRDVPANGSRKQSPDKSLNWSPQGSNSPELKKKQSLDRGKQKEALPEVVIKPGPDKVYSVKIEIAKDCSNSSDKLGKGGIKEVSSEFSKKHSTNNVHGTGKVHSKELEQKHSFVQINDTKTISKVTEKQLPEKVHTQKVEKSLKKLTGKQPIVESSQIKEFELQTKQLSEKKLGKKYPDKDTTKVTVREEADTRQQEDICVDVFSSDSEITGDPLIQTVFVSPESTRTDLHSPSSMERIGRLINEANEISQYLRKDYVFAKCDDDLENNENSLLVKVISKNLGVSCSWSATELKEKLVQMRKFMYEELSENSSKNVDLFLLNSSSNANGEGNNQVNKTERNTNSANTRDKDRQSDVKSSHQSPSLRSPASANVATVKVASVNVATVEVESANVATVKVESANVATVKVESANIATVKDVSPVKVASMNGGALPNVKSAQVTSSNVTSCLPDFPTSVIKEASSGSSFSSAMSYSSGNQNGKLSRSHSTECGGLPEKYLTGSVVPDSSDSVFVPSTKSTQRWSPRTVMSPWGKQILPTNRHHPIKTLQLKSSSSSKSDDSGEHTPRETHEMPAEEFKCSSDFSIYKLCKDLTSMTLLRFTENSWQIELLDRILGAIEGIRQGVERVQKIYAGDRKNEKLNSTGRFPLGSKSSTSIAQVSICLEILQTTVSILCLKTHNPGDIELAEAHENLLKVSKEITKQMIVLWQSCEIQADDSICDSISSVHRNLLLLATECGKLAAVLNTCPALLSSNSGDLATEGPTDDLLTLPPSFEVKLSFICGCDNIVNKMLHDSQDALVKRQEYLQSLCTLCQDCSNAEDKQEILLNVYRVTAACRTVLILLQKIQAEVNSTMKINSNRSTTYLSDLFQSGIFIMNEIQTLVDNSELLIRASVPLHTDFDSGTLKKIVRCADLVQRSNEKLARACNNVPSANSPVTELSRTSSDEPSTHCKYTAILSRSQATTLRQTLEASRQAAQVLIDVVELKMTINDLADTGKVKRLLPVTPHGNLLRCKSASSSHSINSRSSTYRSNFNNRSSTVTTEL